MAGCDVTRLASAETSQSQGWRILQTGEAAAAETQKIGEKAERVEVTPRGSWRAAMTTLHTRKEPLLRGVSPTPSKIPVLSQRCPDFSSVKSCSQDRENQDPRRLSQKVSTPHPLIGSAAPRSKTLHHTEKSQKLGITRLRNPLEELKPSCGGANVGHVSHTQTEASGAIEFVADPAALATILSGEGVKSCPLGRQSSLAQRVLVRGSKGGTTQKGKTSYSSLKQLTIRPKTQCTPLRSLPRVQQTQWLSGLSPHSSPEEPAMPWEQIAVRLFDQEGCITLQKGSGKPSVASTSGPHPSKTPNHQELKMQRISLLQQLLQQEIEGLAVDKCAPLNGGSALEMTKLQPLLADISKTLSAPEHNSGTSLLGLSKHSGVTEPYLAEECEEPQPHLAEKHGEPQACTGKETKVVQPSSTTEPQPPVPCWIAGPEQLDPCLPALPGPLLPSSQGQAGSLEACPRIELGPSAAYSLEASNPESSPQPCCSQGPPATTSLTFSSQSSLCARPPIHSLQPLRSPAGQSGPSSLAPRTLALRQRLRACLTAIHCFHEARLDDECAFYTSRTPPPGPTRVCTNPVATLLEWQDALVSLQYTARPYCTTNPRFSGGCGGASLASFTKK
ncbi:trophinin associated protein [Cricetulus griseus]